MNFNRPVTEIIQQRFSCRTYQDSPIKEDKREKLSEFMTSLSTGPFGTSARFYLAAVTQEERSALRGLGTYGFIKGATGFIIGAIRSSKKDFEDFGYLMECIILFATSLELGTCWLGGSFTRGSFTRRINLRDGEQLPAVAAVGQVSDPERARRGFIRQYINADQRYSWRRMFWKGRFKDPLTPEEAGDFETPLEMVRLGPSASNRQPWQVVKEGGALHFYLHRTSVHRQRWLSRILNQSDLQRVDLGIAMCHFDLTAREFGLKGGWVVKDPAIEGQGDMDEYTASWVKA